eukprot:7619345-Lingulodinium_polyedra.AAC.1
MAPARSAATPLPFSVALAPAARGSTGLASTNPAFVCIARRIHFTSTNRRRSLRFRLRTKRLV